LQRPALVLESFGTGENIGCPIARFDFLEQLVALGVPFLENVHQ
jgi:hypothetical protein